MIEIISSFDKSEWNKFVHSHSMGNIFQSNIIAEVFNRTKNYKTISLMAIDGHNGKVLGVLQSVIISEMQGMLANFSSRAIIQGGPLFKDSEKGADAAHKMLQHYNDLVRSKIVYTQIRNMWDTGISRQLFKSLNFVYEDHLNFLINIDRKEEEIWTNIHKSRRKGINRAEKNGLSIRKVETMDELRSCYELVVNTYRRFKVPIADRSLFEVSWDVLVPIGFADFFVGFKDNEIVGTRITLNYKDMVYDWYAGSKPDVEYVDEALVWHVLKTNAEKYKVFDFGGAGHPDKPYGVREFKRRFGGEMVNFGRYEKIHSNTRKKIAMVGMECLKNLSR